MKIETKFDVGDEVYVVCKEDLLSELRSYSPKLEVISFIRVDSDGVKYLFGSNAYHATVVEENQICKTAAELKKFVDKTLEELNEVNHKDIYKNIGISK